MPNDISFICPSGYRGARDVSSVPPKAAKSNQDNTK